METLKLKFKLNGLEFEIEGREDTVKEESEIYRKFITDNLLSIVNVDKAKQISDGKTIDVITDESLEYPALKELVMKDLPKTEIEWVLVYSFYSSNFGTESFREEDIKTQYDYSKRKNSSRMKNFAANLSRNISNNYIKVLNQEEYIMTPIGKTHCIEILEGKSNSKVASAKKSSEKKEDVSNTKPKKGKSKTSSVSLSLINDLNLNPKNEVSLKEFFKKYVVNSFFEKNTLFVYYLQKNLNHSDITINHVYTCYKCVSERLPGNLYQSLIDTKNAKGWLDLKNQNFSITISGENYVEYDVQKNEE